MNKHFSQKRQKNFTPSKHVDSGHGLARVLSKLGIMSRKDAFDLVKSGAVQVNGEIIQNPEYRTFIEEDKIEIEGKPVFQKKKIYLALNKPPDVITTFRDPQGRPTVYSCLPALDSWVFPVGRLDAGTLGLLLFTNDTAWADQIAGEHSKIPKVYEVKVRRNLSEETLDQLRKGIQLEDGEMTQSCQCKTLKINEGTQWLEITLWEGKNRQIRRMIKAVGSDVVKLRRIAIGNLQLGDIKCGEVRFLSYQEARYILKKKPHSLSTSQDKKDFQETF